MDDSVLQQLLSTGGTTAALIGACWWLVRKMEIKQDEYRSDVNAREEILRKEKQESDAFSRNTMKEISSQQAAALNNVAKSLSNLPCRTLRQSDIERILVEAKQEIKEEFDEP